MIAYDRLSQIIPPDQALASKALTVALSQISNIKNTSLPGLASAYKNVATVNNLNQIGNLTTPLPTAVESYYQNSFEVGSGPGNTLVISDMIGTSAGIGYTDQFENVTQTIASLQSDGTLTALTGIYGDIANSINSVYGDAISGPVAIPTGPAAGTYNPTYDGFGNIIVTAAQNAVIGVGTGIGCIPAANIAINNIIAANSVATNSLNSNFNSMSQSIVSENTTLNLANIVLPEIRSVSAQYSSAFIQILFSYGTNVQVNGPAQYLEAIANINDIGGQAMVASMRQGRNNAVLTTVGVVPNNTVDPVVTPGTEVANLLPSTYTTQQAANLIIK